MTKKINNNARALNVKRKIAAVQLLPFPALSSDKMELGCCKTDSPWQNGSFKQKACGREWLLQRGGRNTARGILLCGFNVMLIDSTCPPFCPCVWCHRSTMKDGIANNSTASISQARKAVEQLKMEACMDRIKVRFSPFASLRANICMRLYLIKYPNALAGVRHS